MALDEIAASLYAWDLADEGIKRCLDNLEGRADVNSAYLIGVMHKEKRPLHQRHYPHNPVRKYYTPEDSRTYWVPDTSCYEDTPIKPLTTDREFLKGVDWLDTLIEEARGRGMKTGCEVSHTIIDAAVARAEYPEVLQRDIYGQIVGSPEAKGANRALPCLNQEAVQAYLVGLFDDVTTNHDVDYVQTCLVLFGAGSARFSLGGMWEDPASSEWQRVMNVATGGCFCDACEAKATAQGLDWEAVRHETRRLADVAHSIELEDLHEHQVLLGTNMTAAGLILENPNFAAWLQFRVRSVTAVFERIHTLLSERNVDFRYNTYLAEPELGGLDFRSAFQHVDSVRESDYSDQFGTLEGIEIKRRKLLKARRALGYEKPLLAALGVRPRATAEVLRGSVRIAHETGCDGLSLGHYDGATMERLDAVKQGLIEAEGREEFWLPENA